MSHDVIVTKCCRHGPVWYSNETHNLDKYLCYKSQIISTFGFFSRVGVANVGTDSLHVHVRGLFGKFVEFGHKMFKYRYTAFIF